MQIRFLMAFGLMKIWFLFWRFGFNEYFIFILVLRFQEDLIFLYCVWLRRPMVDWNRDLTVWLKWYLCMKFDFPGDLDKHPIRRAKNLGLRVFSFFLAAWVPHLDLPLITLSFAWICFKQWNKIRCMLFLIWKFYMWWPFCLFLFI